MSQAAMQSEVFTIEEIARYLRVPEDKIRQLVSQHRLPGRQIDEDWRFLKSAVDEWLRGPSGKDALLAQAGALADDESLGQLRSAIYRERGRPEAEDQ